MTGDIMTIDGCEGCLNKIAKARNGQDMECGGNAAYAFIKRAGVKILGDECIEDGTEPIVYLSLDEYERIVILWKKFLETKQEIQTTVEIDDKSILWEQAQENAKKKKKRAWDLHYLSQALAKKITASELTPKLIIELSKFAQKIQGFLDEKIELEQLRRYCKDIIENDSIGIIYLENHPDIKEEMDAFEIDISIHGSMNSTQKKRIQSQLKEKTKRLLEAINTAIASMKKTINDDV